MLALDTRAARYTWTAFLVVLLIYIVYLLRKTLLVFVLSLLFAYLLSPLVDMLDRLLPARRTRTLALGLAYVIFVTALVFGGMQIGTRVVDQANAFIKQFPALIQKWEQPSPAAAPAVNSLKSQIIQKIQKQIQVSSGAILEQLPRAGLTFLTLASDAIYIVVIPILAFFFLKDASELRRHLLDTVENVRRREMVDDLLADVHLLLAHYMRALVLLSVATFTAYSIFFLIIGVPYTVLLAALAGVLEFVPMIGPLTAAVVVVIVAAVSGVNVLPIIIFLAVYRVFQDYVLSPHIMGQGVEMHPLFVLFGVFAGAEIAGIAGAFLSVPILALLRIVYIRVRKARATSELAPVPSSVSGA
jgi:predicted PurR-regulated permease PerM